MAGTAGHDSPRAGDTPPHPPLPPPPGGDRRPADLMDLHGQLLAGRRTASEALIGRLMTPVARYLSYAFPHIDDHLLQEAAADALWDHCKRPDRYDASRDVTLEQYVRMTAWRKASKLVRAERRLKDAERRAMEATNRGGSVADDMSAGNSFVEEVEQYLSVLPEERDRSFMRLLVAGESDPRRLADALGLPARLSADEVQAAVKRATDRIRKTLSRKGPKRGGA